MVCSFSFLTDCYLRQPGPPCPLILVTSASWVLPFSQCAGWGRKPFQPQLSRPLAALAASSTTGVIREVRADTFRELTFLRSL